MDRVIISPIEKDGKYDVVLNPNFIYLDASAWIDMFEAYSIHKERIIEEIAKTIGDNNFRILFSVVNFLELIGKDGDISKNFSAEYLHAIDYVPIVSAHQPTIVTNQEVFGFLDKDTSGVRILDSSNLALKKMIEGFEQRKRGNTAWFEKERRWWDEMQERDRVLDLEADIWELSGIQPSPSNVIKLTRDIMTGPIRIIKNKRSDLVKKKITYKGKKQIPLEEKEILKYAGNGITFKIGWKYGEEKVSMLISKPSFVFPGEPNILMDLRRDLKRGTELTFPILKKQLPALYWLAKVTYYNYYHGRQRSGGQSGDRNHAVYIPYSNYFATSDRLLVNALKSEYTSVFHRDNLYLFRIM